MTGPVDMPPEVATDSAAPDDQAFDGSLNESESLAISSLRRRGQQIQMQIGEIEINKAKLLGGLADLENQAQRVLSEAGRRLGIPDGVPWVVSMDGKVKIVPGGENPRG